MCCYLAALYFYINTVLLDYVSEMKTYHGVKKISKKLAVLYFAKGHNNYYSLAVWNTSLTLIVVM